MKAQSQRLSRANEETLETGPLLPRYPAWYVPPNPGTPMRFASETAF
jgi:hypothetical protein